MLRKLVSLLLSLLCLLALSSAALAAAPKPGWEINGRTFPTNLAPGSEGVVAIHIYNVGAGDSSGPITVTDQLPPGIVAVKSGELVSGGIIGEAWKCGGATVVTCVSNPSELPTIMPGDGESREELDQIGIVVRAEPGASGTALSHLTIAAGGASQSASFTEPITVSSTPAPFGLTGYDAWFSNADGTVDTQAGSHPYAMTVSFDVATPGEQIRDIAVNLPPGLVGDPHAVPQCANRQMIEEACPPSTQIGMDVATLQAAVPGDATDVMFVLHFPVYNMVPPPGEPAQFAFTILGVSTFIDASVRSGSDYGITENTKDIAQRKIDSNTITIWGVPGDASHDAQRFSNADNCYKGCSGASDKPLLTLPTSCTGPQESTAFADSWENQGGLTEASFLTHDANQVAVGFTGCDRLSMQPSIDVSPDTAQADTPAGLSVDVKVPQEGLGNAEGLSAADIKNTTVTLPEGVVINPGQAAGLAACQTSESAIGTDGPPSCPAASKVGTVAIATPLLTDKLEGDVYVLQSNPPNLKLLVAASGEGVNVKLVGNVQLDERTGRLTTTFKETPELPFTDFKLSFSGGAQAALDTPVHCGSYTTSADFTPWSTPSGPDSFPTASFSIDSGPGGTPCPTDSLPFSPQLTAGSTTDQAGGYTSFSLLLQRADGQQRISTLQFRTPEGLLGMISKVPLCGEPQASQGTCSAASQIGHTVVAAGPGPYPLVVPEPGQSPAPIYLTGGYKGAPYGLSIAVPVIAGPFNLGTVVVRASIAVDPRTAQLTVTTDPLPAILDGIPTDLRTINAVIDRPGFMFNPTNCEPQSFSGIARSTEGASAPIASHFQVGSCRSLTFKPNFKVSTSAKTNRQNGASLDAKIVYPTGDPGANQASSQANIASVKVDLPKQLPSRLTTLQKACTSATFEADPANCPADSIVGHATATTPLLPVGLSGPAYFVSYGGAKFPELVVVLQGYGVTVDLHGETFISKAGITSSTFRQVPDVPVTTFELNLPQGKFSALAANLPLAAHGSFCNQKLTMPTAFTAQNGAVMHQATPITPTGCPKTKHSSKKHKANTRSAKNKKKK
ncbi:MAG: hypothetical protein WBV85_14555 [Solirubrobacteraceae bacterium]